MRHPASALQEVVAWGELMQGEGGVTRGNATSSQHINKRWRHDERWCNAEVAQWEVTQQPAGALMSGGSTTRGDVRREAAQQEVTQQPAKENKRQMEGTRRKLCIERQWHAKNGAMKDDATISQGKQEDDGKQVWHHHYHNNGDYNSTTRSWSQCNDKQWGTQCQRNEGSKVKAGTMAIAPVQRQQQRQCTIGDARALDKSKNQYHVCVMCYLWFLAGVACMKKRAAPDEKSWTCQKNWIQRQGCRKKASLTVWYISKKLSQMWQSTNENTMREIFSRKEL
jgi:hypothetical protein